MKIQITVERVEDNKYIASMPVSSGHPMQAEGDTPGEAMGELGTAIDIMLLDSGWDELERDAKRPAR